MLPLKSEEGDKLLAQFAEMFALEAEYATN
jgi:hypothetical protein